MNFSQSFRLAIKSLMTSKMRALLTMLGIIIGVGAVIVITSLGNGLQNLMNDQFASLGANLIQVQIWGDGASNGIKPEEMYELVDKYPQYLDGVSTYVMASGVVRYGSEEYERTSVYGASEVMYKPERNQLMSGESLAEGRFLSYVDVDRNQPVCVIGSYLAQEAFQGDALGKTLTVQGEPVKIIGVLAEYADSTEGSYDDVIYIPYGIASRISGTAQVNFYLVNSQGKDTAPMAKAVVEQLLYQEFQGDRYYNVMSSAEIMDTMNTMISAMMIVLVAIAAISLLVGGIGIMNIMLVSVTERTREIGIRKSLGAKRRDIRGQFIIEAGTTSAIGGILGILVGVGLANLASIVVRSLLASQMGGSMTFSATPTAGSVGIAFGVSVGIGILFGYLPANKAAKLNPIDALRYD